MRWRWRRKVAKPLATAAQQQSAAEAARGQSRQRRRGVALPAAGAVLRAGSRYHQAAHRWLSLVAEREIRAEPGPDRRGLAHLAGPQLHHRRAALLLAAVRRFH